VVHYNHAPNPFQKKTATFYWPQRWKKATRSAPVTVRVNGVLSPWINEPGGCVYSFWG
jgi:hypothetical protein